MSSFVFKKDQLRLSNTLCWRLASDSAAMLVPVHSLKVLLFKRFSDWQKAVHRARPPEESSLRALLRPGDVI